MRYGTAGCRGTPRPACGSLGAKRTKRFLSHVEVAQLAQACGAYGLLVQVLAYTGLRGGEVAALRVQDVDQPRRRLRVDRAMVEVNGRAIFGTPKNHQRRSLPVPRFLMERLAEHVAGRPGDELLFPSPDGSVLRNQNFRQRQFDRAAASVGLAGLTPHELRHTAASLAVAARANVKAVQQMLGHASAAMTLDAYAGLSGTTWTAWRTGSMRPFRGSVRTRCGLSGRCGWSRGPVTGP